MQKGIFIKAINYMWRDVLDIEVMMIKMVFDVRPQKFYVDSLEWLAAPKKAESPNIENEDTLSNLDEMDKSKLPF